MVTSTIHLHGRCDACGTGLALVACLVADSRPGRRGTLRGKRGACSHPPPFCVAGMLCGDIDVPFAWQAWRLWHWAGSGGALGRR